MKHLILSIFLCISLVGSAGEVDSCNSTTERMETSLKYFASKYKIPLRIAYGIAYKETTYRGKRDSIYRAPRKSSAGALGPMQVMPSTAKLLDGDEYLGDQVLIDSIEYNVELSMRLLRSDLDRLGNLREALGCYNTGKRTINSYAEFVYDFDPNKYHIK